MSFRVLGILTRGQMGAADASRSVPTGCQFQRGAPLFVLVRYDVWDMVSCVSLEGTEHDN